MVAVFACVALSACGNDDKTETPDSTDPVTYTVTFDAQGHGTAPASQTVAENGYATEPAALTAEGYNFLGWYKESACTNVFTFTTEKITGNITLYAKWEVQNTEGDGSEPADDTSVALTGKIYLVGDSTVCSFNDNYYLPRYGYGTQLYNYINCDEGQIVNLALSGRSSLSFLSESNYTTLKNSIGEGDYLIIGFGHNDEKSDDSARFTDPQKSYTDDSTPASFQYVLYNNYIKLAKDKGATAILCTPIVRYSEKNAYTGSVVHNTSDGDYSQAIRTLGDATDTTVIDLTEITKAYYTADNEAAALYHAYSTYTLDTDGTTKIPDGIDTTHINLYGAKKVAYELTRALLNTDCALKNNVITNSAAPTEEDFQAAINVNYSKPDYTQFDSSMASSAWNITASSWYGTAMGDISKTTNFTVSEANGTFTVGASGSYGKIASNQDGFAAAFMQIDVTHNFTATAKVKVTTLGAVSSQSAFGMMLRDDIYIDTVSSTISSNYVTAGALLAGAATDGNASASLNFSRVDGSLKKTSNAITITTQVEYEVKIVRIGQVVTVSFNDGTNSYETTHTDLSFVGVDYNYMYLCLFATRGIIAEFYNVSYTYTGEAQGA